MGLMQLFKAIIIVQLLFSFGITALTHSMPSDTINFVSSFSELGEDVSLQGVSKEFQENLERQTSIPVIDIGALVFYSGNILIDLILNFMFAIPEMLGLIVNGVMMLLSIDTVLVSLVELFASVLVSVLYIIGIFNVIIGIRSGRTLE